MEVFNDTRLSSDSATVQKWTLDGFTRPAMLSVGVGGNPIGQGAKIAIIDDPLAAQRNLRARIGAHLFISGTPTPCATAWSRTRPLS